MNALELNDGDFLAAVASASLPDFKHRDHLRLAWLCLREHGPDFAAARVAALIRSYAEAKGAHTKFDAELTARWMGRVAEAMRATRSKDFEAFLQAAPELMA